MSLSLYRKCELGKALEETLKELQEENKINDNIKEKALDLYDRLMGDEISKYNKNKKCTIKGNVTSFRNCDDIWIFNVVNMTLHNERESYNSPSCKIVACDAKMRNNMTTKKD